MGALDVVELDELVVVVVESVVVVDGVVVVVVASTGTGLSLLFFYLQILLLGLPEQFRASLHDVLVIW